jgi:hypothetical protein
MFWESANIPEPAAGGARLNQIPLIFTEDFEHARRVEGVQFLNPLLPAFDLAPWS